MNKQVNPTGIERHFADEEIIVSKTDRRGRMIYVNDVFIRVSGFTESELIGQPHSLIRHPGMPRCVFKLLWDTIESGREIFAYVINMAKNGDHYWVLAHVTPTFSPGGEVVGFHSNRRTTERKALAVIEPLYRELCAIEQRHAAKADQIASSSRALAAVLEQRRLSYEEFAFAL